MKRLLIVHYAGDFRDAWQRMQTDGSETYYGHTYILNELIRLARRHGAVGYLSCLAPYYRDEVGQGVTLMGGGANPLRDPDAILRQIRAYAPTHFILHGPMMGLLRGCMGLDAELGCLFADSFALHLALRWLRYRGMAGLLGDPRMTLVGNHGINAARGLVDLGVDAGKVIAWDFPHRRHPQDHPPRDTFSGPVRDLLYVGSLERKKGVGDAIRAMALLQGKIPARLTIVGSGQVERFTALARRLGVSGQVDFAGKLPNAEVFARMGRADAVLVPSRHAFPEGLPLTLYEALAARAPVIASDHPMFRGHLRDRDTAMVFRGGSAPALARAIVTLFDDPQLYRRLSRDGARAWQSMQVPVTWGTLIDRWVGGSDDDRHWLGAHSLAAQDIGMHNEP